MALEKSADTDEVSTSEPGGATRSAIDGLLDHVLTALAAPGLAMPPSKALRLESPFQDIVTDLVDIGDRMAALCWAVILRSKVDEASQRVGGLICDALLKDQSDTASAYLAKLEQRRIETRATFVQAVANRSLADTQPKQISLAIYELCRIRGFETAERALSALAYDPSRLPNYPAIKSQILAAKGRQVEAALARRSGRSANLTGAIASADQFAEEQPRTARDLIQSAGRLLGDDRAEEAFTLLYRHRALLVGSLDHLVLVLGWIWSRGHGGTRDRTTAVAGLATTVGLTTALRMLKAVGGPDPDIGMFSDLADRGVREAPSTSFWSELAAHCAGRGYYLFADRGVDVELLERALAVTNEIGCDAVEAISQSGYRVSSASVVKFRRAAKLSAQWDPSTFSGHHHIRRHLTLRAAALLQDARRRGRGLMIVSVHTDYAFLGENLLLSLAPGAFGLRCATVYGARTELTSRLVAATRHLPLPPDVIFRSATTQLELLTELTSTLRAGGAAHVMVDRARNARELATVPWLLMPFRLPVLAANVTLASGAECAFGLCYVGESGDFVLDFVPVAIPPDAATARTRGIWLMQRLSRTVRQTFRQSAVPVSARQAALNGGLPAPQALIAIGRYFEQFPAARDCLFGKVLLDEGVDLDNVAIATSRSLSSFSDVRRRALQAAAMVLHFQGSKPEHATAPGLFGNQHRVLAILPLGEAAIALTLGALAAGSLFCLTLADVAEHETLARIDAFRPDLIIAIAAVADKFPQRIWQDFNVLVCDGPGDGESVEDLTESFAPASALPAFLPVRPSLVVFTSGSTGTPKGVTLTHELHIAGTGIDRLERLEPGERVVYLTRWDAIGLADLLAVLRGGAGLYVPDVAVVTQPGALVQYLKLNRIDVFSAPATIWHILSLSPAADGELKLRSGVLWGERIRWPLAEKLATRMPATQFSVTFGASEASYVSYGPLPRARLDSERIASPGGRPAPAHRLRLIDPQGDEVAACGEPGRIEVSGPDVMLGYFDLLLAADVAPSSAQRTIVLEDTVKLGEDGSLEVLGRSDSLVKIAGRRISLIEVEAAAESVPGIGRAIAFVHEGNFTSEIHLAVECADTTPEQAVSDRVVERTFAAARPSKLIRFSSLPMLSGGKVDRIAVKRKFDGNEAADAAPSENPAYEVRPAVVDMTSAVAAWATASGRVNAGLTISSETRLDGSGPFDSIALLELFLYLETLLGRPIPLDALTGSAIETVGGLIAAVTKKVW